MRIASSDPNTRYYGVHTHVNTAFGSTEDRGRSPVPLPHCRLSLINAVAASGTLVILVEVCFGFLGTTQVRSNILWGALGAALAVLGPGIRSIDALRYVRKRFDIRDP